MTNRIEEVKKILGEYVDYETWLSEKSATGGWKGDAAERVCQLFPQPLDEKDWKDAENEFECIERHDRNEKLARQVISDKVFSLQDLEEAKRNGENEERDRLMALLWETPAEARTYLLSFLEQALRRRERNEKLGKLHTPNNTQEPPPVSEILA